MVPCKQVAGSSSKWMELYRGLSLSGFFASGLAFNSEIAYQPW